MVGRVNHKLYNSYKNVSFSFAFSLNQNHHHELHCTVLVWNIYCIPLAQHRWFNRIPVYSSMTTRIDWHSHQVVNEKFDTHIQCNVCYASKALIFSVTRRNWPAENERNSPCPSPPAMGRCRWWCRRRSPASWTSRGRAVGTGCPGQPGPRCPTCNNKSRLI